MNKLFSWFLWRCFKKRKWIMNVKIFYEIKNIYKLDWSRSRCRRRAFDNYLPNFFHWFANINIKWTVSSLKNFAKNEIVSFWKLWDSFYFTSLFKGKKNERFELEREEDELKTFLLPSVSTLKLFFITQLKKFHCAVSHSFSTSYIFCDSNFFTNFSLRTANFL